MAAPYMRYLFNVADRDEYLSYFTRRILRAPPGTADVN